MNWLSPIFISWQATSSPANDRRSVVIKKADKGFCVVVSDRYSRLLWIPPPPPPPPKKNCDSLRKMTPPCHNNLENSDSPQVIITPLTDIANQWRVNINWRKRTPLKSLQCNSNCKIRFFCSESQQKQHLVVVKSF